MDDTILPEGVQYESNNVGPRAELPKDLLIESSRNPMMNQGT